MTYLLIGFVIVLLVPLFAASWRTSLLGIALQGLLLGSIALRTHEHASASAVLSLVDLFVVRGIVAPQILYRILSTHNAPRRGDIIPSNLFSWALVATFVLVSFRFATATLTADFTSSLHLASATSALVLGMYVLSSQSSMFSQMVGLLRIENAIALFELMSPHRFPAPIQVGVSIVFAITVLLFGRFLRVALQYPSEPKLAEERPTL